MQRQQIFVRALIEQGFDFALLLADQDLVQMSGAIALEELAAIDTSWRMQTFEDTRNAVMKRMEVVVKGSGPVSLDALKRRPLKLAVVVIALSAPEETVDAVKSLLKQKPQVEIVVVNSGGGGMAKVLALPRETSKPRTPPCLHRACSRSYACL